MDNLDYLAKQLGLQFEAEHICFVARTEPGRARILRVDEPSGWGRTWLYVAPVFTTEREVTSGEAVEVGELIQSHEQRVRYCPFCGVDLSSAQQMKGPQ